MTSPDAVPQQSNRMGVHGALGVEEDCGVGAYVFADRCHRNADTGVGIGGG